MLDLNNTKWKDLEHAYGSAEDIPEVLNLLKEGKNVWDELWSTLCHQGTIYSATFAALPHITSYLKENLNNNKVDSEIYLFATCVEISRQTDNVEIPKNLESDYFIALEELKKHQYKANDLLNGHEDLLVSLAYQAVLKKQPVLAELLLNMDDKSIEDTSEWFFNREI